MKKHIHSEIISTPLSNNNENISDKYNNRKEELENRD